MSRRSWASRSCDGTSVSRSSASSSIRSRSTARCSSSISTGRLSISMRSRDGRLVDEVDRLVGQEARRDVAVGQRRRRDQRGVGDLHLVVRLVAALEPAQDRHGVLDGRLADQHLLEPPLQRGVLLDAGAVLVEGGGARPCAARRGPASA
jgi:hypothetical protein